jgi:hypothetical protein
LLFRPHSPKNNPEGRSVIRNAYRAYYFIKRLEELEAIVSCRNGGRPKGRPRNRDDPSHNSFGSNIEAIRAGVMSFASSA